ncbi:hypothetical protein MMC09_003366 [Bachmanniomyces sp. S44760]|nr:hypothetical protein [Bachmanniomyces sp. S44760]
MSGENSPPFTPSSPTARRASFAPGQKFSELFRRPSGTNGSSSGVPSYPGPIAAAAAANVQAQQRRRMSISTLGLSGSPTQTSPFTSAKMRGDSFSSGASGSGSPSIDENAIEEGDAAPNTAPTTPFARRLSFGARALRDVKSGSESNFNGRSSVTSAPSPPSTVRGNGRGSSSSHRHAASSSESPIPIYFSNAHSQSSSSQSTQTKSNRISRHAGEGFNWSDQLRSRAERSSSINNSAMPTPPAAISGNDHPRAASIAIVEPPVREMPKQPKQPDHFQERILKGDFYMD